VPVYDLTETEGRVFLAMRFMPGGSLKDLLAKQGRLPFERAVELTRQIASALDYAYSQPEKLVHRDVKPGNVLFDVSREGETQAARLTDFGFAKALSGANNASLSASGGMIGSPAYMAPETWRGKGGSPASDVYSLACMFYEMITGQVLFAGDSPPEVMTKHVIDGPQLPAAWPQGVPAGVGVVLRKALAKEPEERYPSADAFAVALKKLLVPVPIPPISVIQPAAVVRTVLEELHPSISRGEREREKTQSIIPQSVKVVPVIKEHPPSTTMGNGRAKPARMRLALAGLGTLTVVALVAMVIILLSQETKDVLCTNASPEQLRKDYQADYLRMAIDSYIKNQDVQAVISRWDSLGNKALDTMARVNYEPLRLKQEEIVAFERAVFGGSGNGSSPISTTVKIDECTNASPEQLQMDYQADYLRMMIDSYIKTQDVQAAKARWNYLGGKASAALENVKKNPLKLRAEEIRVLEIAVASP
jgi:serine/threonine protein kinase